MSRLRLIPVLIVAAAALLLLKGVGLISGSGYLLAGVPAAVAAGAPAPAAGGHGEAGATLADGVPSIELPGHPTLKDNAPTLDDHAPTMAGGAGTGGHGTGAPANHSIPAPVTADGQGARLPLQGLDTPPADDAVLTRLAERRQELDARDADLDMRLALVEAAERRMAERMAELAALEAQIAALVDQKEGAEAAQFKGLVTMYETMKPREAAAILNTLDVGLLVPIARGIAPRRMAPILAAMDPGRAQDLTARLAAGARTAAAPAAAPAPAMRSLPQIIGQ